MKTKVTQGYEQINKDAFIGKLRKNIITVHGGKKVNVVASKKQRTGCGGCSRRRPK